MWKHWMGIVAIVVGAALGSVLLAGCGDDDSGDSAMRELPADAEAAYQGYTNALLAADGDAMLAYVTDDFTFLSYGIDPQERDFRAEYVTENYKGFAVEEIGERIVVGGDDEYIFSAPERATTPIIAEGISVVKIVKVDGGRLVQAHRFLGEGPGSG